MPQPEAATDLARMAGTLRRWIVTQSLASNVGHIGSALSIVDVIAVLYGAVTWIALGFVRITERRLGRHL